MNKVLKGIAAILIVIAAILIVILGPFLLVWSINTLFPVLAIEYTLDTWLAVIILLIFAKEASIRIGK